MKSSLFFAALSLALWHCTSSTEAPVSSSLTVFPVRSSVRALEVVDSNTVWFAGSGGQYGYTLDGGRNWRFDSLRFSDTAALEFRALAVTNEAVHMLCTGSPALLYRSEDRGENWSLVYREDHPACFYDAMAFWDDRHGLAIGDPTDGCLALLRTEDGGRSWQKLPCSALPATEEDEFAFAASNTNIALRDNHAWIATGGAKARVLHSPDRGKTWEIFDTPIVSGGAMTGIFSIDFYDEKTGIVFGGDWQNQARNTQNKAVSTDGGHSWQLLADGQEPGYRSCVRYVPGRRGKELFAVGMPGISHSADGGENWTLLRRDTFYTIRMSPVENTAWLAGPGKVAKMTW